MLLGQKQRNYRNQCRYGRTYRSWENIAKCNSCTIPNFNWAWM